MVCFVFVAVNVSLTLVTHHQFMVYYNLSWPYNGHPLNLIRVLNEEISHHIQYDRT